MSSFPISNHGLCIPMYNGTGTAISKGSCVSVDPTGDFYMRLTPLADPYTCQGFTDNKVEPNTWGSVMQVGMAQMLLEDGEAAFRGNWIRSSLTVPGRIITQDFPGLIVVPSGHTASTGSCATATDYNRLHSKDGLKYTIVESANAPGIDWTFEYTAGEVFTRIDWDVLYTGTPGHTVQLYLYDYDATGWEATPIVTFAHGVAANSFYNDIAAKNYDENDGYKLKVRLLHVGGDIAGHTLAIDKLVVKSDADTEHFKELGHILEEKAAGTDVLVWGSIHLL